MPSDALRDEARRSRRLRRGEQVAGSLPPHARISFAYRSRVIRQIGELVHHRLRLKGHDHRPQFARIERVAYDWLSAQIAQRLNLPRRARHTRNRVPSRDKQRDESHPDHTTRPRNKDLHQSAGVDVLSEVVPTARRARRRIPASQLRRMASLPGRITSQ